MEDEMFPKFSLALSENDCVTVDCKNLYSHGSSSRIFCLNPQYWIFNHKTNKSVFKVQKAIHLWATAKNWLWNYDQCKSGFYSPKSQCLCSPAWRLPSLSPREQSQGRDDGDLVPSVTDADLWRQATSTFVIGVRIRKVMLGPGDPLGRSPWFTPNYWLVHPRPHRILAIIVCLKMNWL